MIINLSTKNAMNANDSYKFYVFILVGSNLAVSLTLNTKICKLQIEKQIC